ncbi:MAG: hypothetical protein H6625_01845 [Bdellovibrionaceae bacterium]|nr:hypothetical protein [Pseudobdellovibrionaceae bacterium]
MKNRLNELKPIISVFFIICTLFFLVFSKMEARRMGYSVLKQSRELRRLQDNYRLKIIEYAKLTSPEHLRRIAVSKFTLSEAEVGQIIHMSGKQIAVKQ